MRFYRSIDWLSGTSDTPPQIRMKSVLVKSPIPFYTHSYRYENGLLVSFGNPNSERFLITMSGKVCSALGLENETNAVTFLRSRIEEGMKFTRIDLAATVEHDGEVTVDAVRQWVHDGLLVGPAILVNHAKTIVNDTDNRGETLYIGDMKKRAKRGIVRVYDKGLERGELPNWLTRFEVELKRDLAHNAVRKIVDGVKIGQVLKSRLNINHALWDTITGGVESPDIRYTDSDNAEDEHKTWRWLIETIAPTLARKICEEDVLGTGPNTRLFMSTLNKLIMAETRKRL